MRTEPPLQQGSLSKRADLRPCRFTFGNKMARTAWNVVWMLLFRPSPRFLYFWRRFLLRCFGARMGAGSIVYPSTRIWAPWNLSMGDGSSLSFDVNCYSVDQVDIGAGAFVSQYSFLCTASHDFNDVTFPTVCAPIRLGPRSWVAADCYVGPGVTIEEGAVVGARASVFKNVPAWTIVGGNPAVPIGSRKP